MHTASGYLREFAEVAVLGFFVVRGMQAVAQVRPHGAFVENKGPRRSIEAFRLPLLFKAGLIGASPGAMYVLIGYARSLHTRTTK